MKQFIYTLTLLFITGLAYSQDTGEFEFGAGLGPSISNVTSPDGNISTNSLFSFNVSSSAEYYLSDRWGIKAKAIYDRKGWADAFIDDAQGVRNTTDFQLDYLTIPVMANWHFARSRRWYGNFGPYVGFLLNAEDSEMGLDLKEGFKSSDFGLATGIGHRFPLNDDLNLAVEFDSQSGLSNSFEESDVDIRNGRSSLNIVLLF